MSNPMACIARVAYEDVIEWCKKEIKAVNRAQERANENCGAYEKEQVLRKAIRVFRARAKKLSEDRSDPTPWAEEVLALFREGVKQAIAEHHKAGRKVPVQGKDGKIEWI
jgi:hypothetical protein